MSCTDASEALKLHAEFADVSEKLEQAESKWLELTEGTDDA